MRREGGECEKRPARRAAPVSVVQDLMVLEGAERLFKAHSAVHRELDSLVKRLFPYGALNGF